MTETQNILELDIVFQVDSSVEMFQITQSRAHTLGFLKPCRTLKNIFISLIGRMSEGWRVEGGERE